MPGLSGLTQGPVGISPVRGADSAQGSCRGTRPYQALTIWLNLGNGSWWLCKTLEWTVPQGSLPESAGRGSLSGKRRPRLCIPGSRWLEVPALTQRIYVAV